VDAGLHNSLTGLRQFWLSRIQAPPFRKYGRYKYCRKAGKRDDKQRVRQRRSAPPGQKNSS
jgi:hypothetical protein